jgi:putative sterol carrier protein
MPTAHELFERAKLLTDVPLLRGVTGTYLFDIEQAGYWFISVKDGAIHIEETKRDADCTISCSESDFIDIVEGRRNLITAGMQGRIQIRGDLSLVQKFHGLVSTTVENRKREAA